MYRSDYPTKPIGGGNPYYACVSCGRADPQINGRLKGHAADCAWRLAEEAKALGIGERPLTPELGGEAEGLADLLESALDDHTGGRETQFDGIVVSELLDTLRAMRRVAKNPESAAMLRGFILRVTEPLDNV